MDVEYIGPGQSWKQTLTASRHSAVQGAPCPTSIGKIPLLETWGVAATAHLEVPLRGSSLGVHNARWDALSVQGGQLLQSLEVLQEDWACTAHIDLS